MRSGPGWKTPQRSRETGPTFASSSSVSAYPLPDHQRNPIPRQPALRLRQLDAPRADAGDRVRPLVPARVERAETGTNAATAPVRLAAGRHGLARVEHAGTAMLAAHANLVRAVAAQLGTARGCRAAGGTRQRQGPFRSLLTDRHDHSDPAPDANPRTAEAPATAAPEGTLAVRLAIHVAEPAPEPKVFSRDRDGAAKQSVHARQRGRNHILAADRGHR